VKIAPRIQRLRGLRDARRNQLDMALRFRLADGPEAGQYTRPYGGVWDRALGRYVSFWDPAADAWTGAAPARIHTIRVSAQSIGYIEDFDSSIQLALGGRRSGKTTGSLAPKILVCALCFPSLPGEVLSPTYRQAHNVWRAILRLAPRNWFVNLLKTTHRMELANGSSVQLLSADREDSARSEGVAWGAYDERQDIPEEAFANAVLSTSEGGELPVMFETATIKAALRDHHDALLRSGTGAVYYMRSRGNPFINHRIFDIAEEFLDQATIDRELEAKWPELQGRCYYPFQRETHVVPWPAQGLRDITAAVAADKFGWPADWLIGLDPPRHAVVCKIYEGQLLHVAREIIAFDGDVRDCARMCREWIGDKADGLVVSDPHETHWDADVRRYFKKERFRFGGIRRVEPEYRLTSVRARMERRADVGWVKHPLLVVDPSCVHLVESLLEQVYAGGVPDKHTASKIDERFTLDHSPDSLGYLVYRLWPAPRGADYEAIQKRVESEERKKRRAA
jgi:hypothetical protein